MVIRRNRLPQGVYSIAELARREGIGEKSARGRLRKYFGGTLSDLGIREWTYGPEDLQFVLDIIRPSRTRTTNAAAWKHSVPITTIKKEAQSASPTKATRVHEKVDLYSWPRKPRIDLILPRASGVYALFLRETSSLPNVNPLIGGLIYIGLGSNLMRRCHFQGKTEGHSPRRTLAALLWQELRLEPQLAANGNYKLSKSSEKRLDLWMRENLLMAFATFDDFEAVEDALIRQYAPPMNLTKCAQSEQHSYLLNLRKAMLEYAKAQN